MQFARIWAVIFDIVDQEKRTGTRRWRRALLNRRLASKAGRA